MEFMMPENDRRKSVKRYLNALVWWGFAVTVLGLLIMLLFNIPLQHFCVSIGISPGRMSRMIVYSVIFWAMAAAGTWFWVVRSGILDTKRRMAYRISLAVLIILAAAGVYALLIPEGEAISPIDRGDIQYAGRTAYGPYPDERLLQELKTENYQGVISLLSPLMPHEKIMLDRERKAAGKIGIKLYSIPVFPLVPFHDRSVKDINHIISSHRGKYYIHCYLGKHRVYEVKESLEQLNNKK